MIIALAGKRGTGKTTFADYLVENYGFKKVSFAASLRDHARRLMGFRDMDLTPEAKERPYKDYPWTPRDFMIRLGALMRFHDEDYWVNQVDLNGDKIVIDDLRFPNEYDYLKEAGATLIRIHRYKSMNVYKGDINDPSETSLDKHKWDENLWEPVNITMQDLRTFADGTMRDNGFKKPHYN